MTHGNCYSEDSEKCFLSHGSALEASTMRVNHSAVQCLHVHDHTVLKVPVSSREPLRSVAIKRSNLLAMRKHAVSRPSKNHPCHPCMASYSCSNVSQLPAFWGNLLCEDVHSSHCRTRGLHIPVRAWLGCQEQMLNFILANKDSNNDAKWEATIWSKTYCNKVNPLRVRGT